MLLKARCTQTPQRMLRRHRDEDALNRMHQRATPEITVEYPFAILKYRIFGHSRFLLRGLEGSPTEISLAVMTYNIKRMVNLLGGTTLTQALRPT